MTETTADSSKPASNTLPRHPHAERPRKDETPLRSGGADLQNGWLARHGTLTLTSTRLVFVPTVLDTFLRARRREIDLDRIVEIEREPRDVEGSNPGMRRPRVIIVDHECRYQFIVGDLDNWIDMLQIVIDRRRSAAGQEPVVVHRDGYTNVLIAEGISPNP